MPKYRITKSRFVQQVGQNAPAYVQASPDFPAVIELPEGAKVDAGLFPLDKVLVAPKPFVPQGAGTVTAAQVMSKPLAQSEATEAAEAKPAGKSQRASDKGPI